MTALFFTRVSMSCLLCLKKEKHTEKGIQIHTEANARKHGRPICERMQDGTSEANPLPIADTDADSQKIKGPERWAEPHKRDEEEKKQELTGKRTMSLYVTSQIQQD